MSLKRKITHASKFYRCFSILHSHKCGNIHTRFHTFIWVRKTGMLNFLIPVVRDIVEDCTSQNPSEFD